MKLERDDDAHMDKLPPARSRYSSEQEQETRARLERAVARRCTVEWVSRKGRHFEARTEHVFLKPTAFVPILDAANIARHNGGDEGFARFWDTLAQSILDGHFDGVVRLHVVDDQPVMRMRFLSRHMRRLTAHMYSYEHVIGFRLSRLWLHHKAAAQWCEKNNFAVPKRWVAAPIGPPKVGRPDKSEGALKEYMRRLAEGSSKATIEAESKYLETWAKNHLPEGQHPAARSISKRIAALQRDKRK